MAENKISSSLPTRRAEPVEAAKYIKYVPQQASSQSKIIRMVSIQKDPCEPPKFRINKKIPQGPPSPPAPVLHSPPRKPSVKDQKEWKIPPCISNWKNPKGFTIPLDKRLAADGRGSQSVQINENFAKLAESLYVADRKAREGVEMRAQMEKKVAQKEKEKKEDILKKLAQKAREERAGLKRSAGPAEDEEERNQIRQERQKERRRERNIERSAPHLKSKQEREREITEQIALNLANPKASSNELQFDQRLIDQTRGLSSGFTEDDEYTVYDKPWKTANELGKNIYRPRNTNQDTEDDLAKITGKSFSGAKQGDRDGPVPFVAANTSNQTVNEDIFGIDTFLKEAKRSTKRKRN
uniref:SKI-interacting protein SKIP SNW domain-containing protein n=2 Tax=Tetranychus urticae TaxID=32264 RepID=T1JXD5_TETUR